MNGDKSEINELSVASEFDRIPVEIIENIFDYLELKDLSAMCGTSKRMQTMACQVYHTNYCGIVPQIKQSANNAWIVRFYRKNNVRFTYDVDFTYFIPCIDRMEAPSLNSYVTLQSNFHQLTKLRIDSIDFNSTELDGITEGLTKLEYMELSRCKMSENFLGNLLFSTPNLRRLGLINCDAGEKWLECRYPTLQQCEITSEKIVPVTKLLTNNPNIIHFGTDAMNLWENALMMVTAEIKLEVLALTIVDGGIGLFELPFWELVKELSVNNRLNLHVCEFFWEFYMIANTVNKLYVHFCAVSTFHDWKLGLNLEDVSFPDSDLISNIQVVATESKNLKQIYFGTSSTSVVKLFVGGNPNLERIRVDWFWNEDEIIEDEKVIDLIDLNRERSKLQNAKKVTLYVQETVYLATKWGNCETNLDFIQLKRSSALRGEYDFPVPELYRRF